MVSILKKGYQNLVFFGSLLKSPVLLFCRLYWGTLFMLGGWRKFHFISAFIQLLTHHHLSPATPLAYLAAGTEFVGGFALFLDLDLV